MLKTLFGLNELRERDLSKSSLRRLKTWSLLAIASVPFCTILDYQNVFDGISSLLKIGVIFLALICIIPFAFSRIASIFTRPAKRLDEWECNAKKEAESFTYKVIRNIMIMFLIGFVLFSQKTDLDTITVSGEVIIYLIGNLLMLSLFLPAAYIAWTKKPLNEI